LEILKKPESTYSKFEVLANKPSDVPNLDSMAILSLDNLLTSGKLDKKLDGEN